YFLSPAEVRLTANTTLRAGAGEPVRTTLEQYILADGAGLTIFLQRDGRWTKTLLDSPELSRVLAMDPAADLKLFMENLQMAELAGEETLDERTAHKIIVRVAGAALSELLPAEGETPNPVGSEAARFLAEGGDLQLTLWLDAENLALLKCQADLTQFMRKLAAGVDAFAARRNLDAATAKALKTALSDIKAEMEYTVAKLNNATPFVLPAEAALAEITPAAPSLTNPAP
ncbi:MAG: hypothetical protein LBH21_08530, partial [Gracilibacteraceae bacterium]|nr:hypothetical protein [Gracilibacteraceae bacterium]